MNINQSPRVVGSIVLAAVMGVGATLRAEPLRLVPTPRQVTMGEGKFVLGKDFTIAVQSSDSEDRLAADQLAAEAKTDLGVEMKVKKGSDEKGEIVLMRKSIDLPAEAIGEGYILNVTPEHVTVEASTSAGLFYGVQTLKQLIRANATEASIPTCSITDWPTLRYRGWQDDISRGPIPTMDFLKQEIRTMSEVKENFFTLYTEHVFKLKKHPEIAPADGITAKEMKELSEYAKQYHVELAGNFQSFGHFANILKVPQYASLGANSWALDPANENVYKFLNDVYSEVTAAYPSSLFCISCDEVGNLEKPDVQAMIKKWGEGGVYAYHINRVTALLHEYGKTPMMWGDIALQHPEDIKKLPRNLIVLPWTYGDSGTYDRWLKPYTEDGYPTIVCPGADCWSRYWPGVDNAVHNISDFTRDGVHYNTLGQLNTTWRDSGETLFGPVYYPLLWGAECAWSPVMGEADRTDHKERDAKQEQFDRSYDGVFYGLAGADMALANRALGTGILANPLTAGNRDGDFWKDPEVAHAEAKNTDAAKDLIGTTDKIMAAAKAAKKSAKYNAYTLDEMVMEAKRIQFLGQRVLVVDSLQQHPAAWQDLLANLDVIKAQYTQLWHLENRDWWLDKNLEKFSKLEASIKALPARVSMMPIQAQFTSELAVTLNPLAPGEIHYTVDGSEPTEKSPTYTGPLTLRKTTTVKARNFIGGTGGPIASNTYAAMKLPAEVHTRMPVYEDNTPERAFDGSDDSFFWSSAPPKRGQTFTVSLNTPAKFTKIAARTGHPTLHRDILEHGVLEVSNGHEWQTVAEFKDGAASGAAPDMEIKSIRIRVTDGQTGWLAIQEIDAE
ncbi:MAG TPA: glycoside hydrolase family 20 zincin-like fold domain-containing protein [Tepidisphaeraceae bacterium]|jgi:hypothetical protein|nr:glycoside hydrolase family 20 zincin-like fold domain-containing protein [Tepidisphaeraceae bacterium]